MAEFSLGFAHMNSSCCEDGHIFVSIAAYADPELPQTMMSLLSAADRPELIRFGIAARFEKTGLTLSILSFALVKRRGG